MPPEPRFPVLDMQPAVHGSLDYVELWRRGLDPDEVLDFSANTNPYGPAPAVQAALADVALERYPDREALALRAALAALLSVPIERVIVGNGASELIVLTALAFVRPGDAVLIVGPTYGEYARASALMGARVISWRAGTDDDFEPDCVALAAQFKRQCPRLAFVCNPNNPTGGAVEPKLLTALARRHPATLFVVDEAYQPFAADLGSVLTGAPENVLVLRSMTKDYGLAGLRLGYAVGAEPLVDALRRVQTPWSVSALAQVAGIAALNQPEHRARGLESLRQATATLMAGLTRIGLPPVPSRVCFFLVRVGDGATFRDALLGSGILVRDCASFGLPAHVRISTQRPEENERLLAAIREAL
jgi:histidinol-phosphate aminotransferase